MAMGLEEYYAKHVGFAIGVHFLGGLGAAWLVSLVWHYSAIALVLGLVCGIGSIAGHIYARLAKP